MSVTVTRTEGVTQLTVTHDPDSFCPPLCQILRAVCYNPQCCSVSQHLRGVSGGSQSALGTLQIMVGLLTVGLGAIVCDCEVGIFPVWLGAVYIFFGVLCIWSDKRPSPCLVLLSSAMNLFGSLFAATAVVMFSINVGLMELWGMCEPEIFPDYQTERPPDATPDPQVVEKCLEGKAIILLLMRGITSVLLVLSMLQLCISISSATLGIKALRSRRDGGNKSAERPEEHKAPLQGGDTHPTT